MDTPPLTVVQVLRDNPALLRFHLFGNDVDPLDAPTIGAFEPATFAGYAPKPPDSWLPLQEGLSPDQAAREMLLAWRSIDAEPQTIFGWFATLEVTPGTHALVGYERLAAPEVMQAGKTLRISVTLYATPYEAGPGLRLVVTHTALAFFGEVPIVEMRGKERQALVDARKALQQIAARDGSIESLTPRSKRSRVYVVPADDAELVAAFATVTARLDLMLAL